jgi:hypothetical protein
MKVIDIGHRGYALDQAISVLETMVSTTLFEGRKRVIKIIHGHGKGALKKSVRDWCNDQQGRFRAIILGEDYDLFHPESAAMRAECRISNDPDLGRRNSAVTYLWLW